MVTLAAEVGLGPYLHIPVPVLRLFLIYSNMMTNEGHGFSLCIILEKKDTQKKGMQAAQLLKSRGLLLK
jgi:hypothetical protein